MPCPYTLPHSFFSKNSLTLPIALPRWLVLFFCSMLRAENTEEKPFGLKQAEIGSPGRYDASSVSVMIPSHFPSNVFTTVSCCLPAEARSEEHTSELQP